MPLASRFECWPRERILCGWGTEDTQYPYVSFLQLAMEREFRRDFSVLKYSHLPANFYMHTVIAFIHFEMSNETSLKPF